MNLGRLLLAALACQAIACGRGHEAARPTKLVITIDVEALPGRQSTAHIQRLIFGRFGDHELGIEEMMRIADLHGFPLTFFLDVCEVDLYGEEALREVASSILSHGHDLQAHCHAQLLADTFWLARGLTPLRLDEDQYPPSHAAALMSFVRDASSRLGNADLVAYRGGGLRYGEYVLNAMLANDIPASFNYAWGLTPVEDEDLPSFEWSNGILEFPLAVDVDGGHRAVLDIANLSDDSAVSRAYDVIDRVARKHGGGDTVVMIGHSWSLLHLDPTTNYFVYLDDGKRDGFERFLANLPKNVQVVSVREAVASAARCEGPGRPVRNVSLANSPPITMATGVSIDSSVPSPQDVGTDVVFTAAGQGSSNYQYQFFFRGPGGSQYRLVQDYGPRSTWQLPASSGPGDYRVVVHVRTSTELASDAQAGINFTLTLPPAAKVDLFASSQSPQTVGTPVAFTAASPATSTGSF